MKKVWLAIFLLLIILPCQNYSQDDIGEELKLYIGEIKMLSVNNPSRIIIGNPDIADVTNVTKQEITVSPKTAGATSLIFWDSSGEHSYRVRVISENLSEIQRRIDNLLDELQLTDVYTQKAEEEGKVLLLGKVKSAQEKERVNVALGTLKDKITDLTTLKEEEEMVDIEVEVLEIDKDATTTLGFTWPGSIQLADVSGPTTTGTTGLQNVFRVSDFTRSAFDLTLDALVQEGKARVLSRPKLACQSGKEAELLVGGEKPILTTQVVFGTASGSSTEVDYKEFGIKLKIKPTVTEDKRIKLVLNVEVSEVGTPEILGSINAPTAKAYPLTKRSASTELLLNDGQTMGIGGLIKQKTEEDVRKTPFISEVPILGFLFRHKITKEGGGQGERGNNELFIAITPTLINNEKVAAQEKKISQLQPNQPVQPNPPNAPKEIPPPAKSSEELLDSTINTIIGTQQQAQPQKKTVQPKIVPSPINEKNLTESIARYAKIIQNRILEHLIYPPLAKEAGFQGTVTLSLHMSYLGKLQDAILKESSGYKILDDQAINAAKGVASYPPFPTSIEQKELWIDIPIAYQLN